MSMIRLWVILLLFPTLAHAQEFAAKRLDDSPRHHEWVMVPSGERNVRSFVAYPEETKKTLAVIVIHENRGLTDWVRSFADQLAAAGYLAIAPDLLSDHDPDHSATSDYPSADEARKALYLMDPDRITGDLLAVRKYIAGVPASNGKTIVIGFCWGGSEAFRFATHSPDLSATLVFYGMAPTPRDRVAKITAPVHAFYGEADQRVTSTVPETGEVMRKHDKSFEFVIYEGAGHAFMRDGDDPEGKPENRAARDGAWKRIRSILSRLS